MKNKQIKLLTLCFIQKENKILLAMKKRGFGAGRYNGYGGKVEANENIKEAAKREMLEESTLKIKKLEKKAILKFDSEKFEKIQEVHVFEIKEYEGEPKETEEMKPKWFDINKIPYKEMWPDDEYWLPKYLEGKKFKASFKFDKNDKVIEHEIKEVKKL
ncbi:8-oxo-dGTP diphosphatase [Candidatus Woesearchaeota archaeon]|nr:8-oxo-dGTP diphosphatase [Candidatus Woesearchaeota archaeon]MCF7901441.1 8-oxo-dGTP diphosphatase [Candidatus Woesearchaeota archaeon]MCF8013013.1 8-oxo-dGTP diphosphatase [Candidatus Woesearchaeota archaeon]